MLNEERYQELFEQVHRNANYQNADEYKALWASMDKEGYTVEHGFGWYLHCPDGRCIVLDYWNEQ